MIALTLLILTTFLLEGCQTAPAPVMDDPAYAPRYPLVSAAVPESRGSLFSDTGFRPMFEDTVARHVGDILIIQLNENTSSTKSSSTTLSKSSDNTIAEPVILSSLLQGVDANGGNLNNMSSSNDFAGSAGSDQSNSLQGSISVTITEVLPNGSFLVRGEKWMKLNQGDEYIRITGLVRSVDISANNTVDSTRIADARITYGGSGAMEHANKPGWLARFFINPFFPY
ncbi:MAG: flagellar basal body L-ring protein FlgH [Pseudomonadales bacterium]|nr:flagellar basal body L-ring protein FlgH [Pseudomonadales bacterium]